MNTAATPSKIINVVVVGGGSAGFAAAIAARQAGAESVMLLEKGAEAEAGGNARFSHTGFRFTHAGVEEIRQFVPHRPDVEFDRFCIRPYTPEDYRQDLVRVTQRRIDPDLANLLVLESNAALHWLLDLGITWDVHGGVDINGYRYFDPGTVICPQGGGIGQVQHWQELAARMGVDVRYEAKVCHLYGNDRVIDGVRVSEPRGEYDVPADAVILASGGFQASAERRARYLGPNADLMKVRGSRHNTGEILDMALALGARSSGQWQGAHVTPIDSTANAVESSNRANRYSYQYGITVNSLGLRFFDEGEAPYAYTYAKTGWAVLAEETGIAYQLFDHKMAKLLNKRYNDARPVQADSITGLADRLRLDPTILSHTVRQFNTAVREDITFDPTKLDGRRTEGVTPDKSNWAQTLDQPPFLAFPVTAGITFTFGGLAVNTSAQVLNTAGTLISNLYATGDILGLFFHNYPSCSGQTRNVVFSRIAGQNAAR